MASKNKQLFHYTDRAGIDGIVQAGKIHMSTDTFRDARLGKGVYLNDLPPSSSDSTILQNNYGRVSASQADKVDYVVKINAKHLPGVTEQRVGDRKIYVTPNEIDLRTVPHSFERR